MSVSARFVALQGLVPEVVGGGAGTVLVTGQPSADIARLPNSLSGEVVAQLTAEVSAAATVSADNLSSLATSIQSVQLSSEAT